MQTTDKPPREYVRSLALAEGFNVIGFTRPTLPQRAQQGLQQHLALGHHGEMGWMETRAEIRSNPALIWPEARSVIVLGHNYAPAYDPLTLLHEKKNAVISVYAQGDDYHDIIKKKLKSLARTIVMALGGDARVYVDTAPVMEKPLAQQAGLGWQGKHTCLVSRDFGAWLFLGEIFTSLDLQPDDEEPDHCGRCTRCLDICPTQAFTSPHALDARKCISYLTIEHKGAIPLAFRKAIGNRIYGCDDCLAICPWNKFAQTSHESSYHPRPALTAPLLGDLVRLDDSSFRTLFSKSPIKRIGRDRFIRNVLIAIGNSDDATLLPLLLPLLEDPAPLVRGACVWAVYALAEEEYFHQLRATYLPREQDKEVQEEWNPA